MKSDEDVRMISAEAPVLFAKVNADPYVCAMLNHFITKVSPAMSSETVCWCM